MKIEVWDENKLYSIQNSTGNIKEKFKIPTTLLNPKKGDSYVWDQTNKRERLIISKIERFFDNSLCIWYFRNGLSGTIDFDDFKYIILSIGLDYSYLNIYE